MNRYVARIFDKNYRDREVELVSKAQLLYYTHFIFISFLALALLMVFLVTKPEDRLAYRIIAITATVGTGWSIYLNLSGSFPKALWLTLALMIVVPWASILYEYCKHSGDYVPMMYMIIPIQIMAMFVPLKPIFFIATVQTAILSAMILLDPLRERYNWPSVICYLYLATMLGTIISYTLRKQYVSIILNQKKLLDSEQKMREVSIRDPLTGLYNRRFMNEFFDQLTSAQSALFSLLMIDIDHLKTINDTYGHTVGDEVIRKVADILVHAARQTDIVCRYGGDEFLMILVDCIQDDALVKAQRVREQIVAITADESDIAASLHPTASIGVAQCAQNCHDIDAMLRSVDKALYIAKEPLIKGPQHKADTG